jgi:hypothetical protein
VRHRHALWLLGGSIVVTLAGASVFLLGLERSDKWASVLSGVAALITLTVTLAGIWRTPPRGDALDSSTADISAADISASASSYRVDRGSMTVVHIGSENRQPFVGASLVLAVLLIVASGVLVTRERAAPAAVSDSSPLRIAVTLMDDMCDQEWITPRSPAELRGSHDIPDFWRDWKLVADGVPVSYSLVLVTAQAAGADSVTITDIDISVERAAPLTGTLLDKPCGGPETFRLVDVDLDAPRPVVRDRDIDPALADELAREGRQIGPVRFPYEVTRQDGETFAIRAHTKTCFCSWTAALRWSSAGRTGTVIINDQGQPFRITADSSSARCTVGKDNVTC